KWKASYMVAERDSKRTILTKDELCGNEWAIGFKAGMGFIMPPELLADGDDEEEGDEGGEKGKKKRRPRAWFRDNYTYESEFFDTILPWRFLVDSVQVQAYPPLRPSRKPDWGWQMENDYVVMDSLAGPDFGLMEG
ncbi:hypothetical protein HK102_003292, partial [Quaeritorhiza haematococci]